MHQNTLRPPNGIFKSQSDDSSVIPSGGIDRRVALKEQKAEYYLPNLLRGKYRGDQATRNPQRRGGLLIYLPGNREPIQPSRIPLYRGAIAIRLHPFLVR